MRRESHVRFGGRTAETHSLRDEQGAAVRPYTYIPMRRGFLYLVAIMDWATRTVLFVAAVEHPGRWKMGGRRVGSSPTGFGITTKSGLTPACQRSGRRWRYTPGAGQHEPEGNECGQLAKGGGTILRPPETGIPQSR